MVPAEGGVYDKIDLVFFVKKRPVVVKRLAAEFALGLLSALFNRVHNVFDAESVRVGFKMRAMDGITASACPMMATFSFLIETPPKFDEIIILFSFNLVNRFVFQDAG